MLVLVFQPLRATYLAEFVLCCFAVSSLYAFWVSEIGPAMSLFVTPHQPNVTESKVAVVTLFH